MRFLLHTHPMSMHNHVRLWEAHETLALSLEKESVQSLMYITKPNIHCSGQEICLE